MTTPIHGARYVGPRPELKGRTALVLTYPSFIMAQFDDMDAPGMMGWGWHRFELADFELRPVPPTEVDPCTR